MKRFNIIQIAYPTTNDFLVNNKDSIRFFDRGYIEIKDWENCDDVWNFCNWKSYQDKKPSNLHSSLHNCNSDIVTWEEGSHEYWVAETVGWKIFNSLEEAKEYMMSDKEYRSWPLRN